MFDLFKGPNSCDMICFSKSLVFEKKVMSRDYGLLKSSKNDLQSLFWDDFYTKPTLKIITKSLEISKLSGKVKIWRD